jgi:hypothetical protein
MPRQIQYNHRGAQREAATEKKMNDESEAFKTASFSPELSFLLAMTMKDGMRQGTPTDMLRSIEPYVSSGDREAIHQILGAQKLAEEYRMNPPQPAHGYPGSGLSDFSRLTRQQALLEILQNYASRESSDMMRALQQSSHMQENFERMIRRMEKLRNMKMSSAEDMFEAMSFFMPPGEQSNFRNMQNMMGMMGNMKGFNPEDMMKFMSMMR